MPLVTGVPVGVTPGAASGGGWKPSDIKEIIDGIKSLYMMAKNQAPEITQGAPAPREIIHEAPAQKCKVESGLENLYALCQNLIGAGHGDDKLSSLLDINSLTIKDAQMFIGKILGR